jgi:hypothetical protein
MKKYQSHSVVQSLAAQGVWENSFDVELPRDRVYSDRNWVLLQHLLLLIAVVLLDVHEAGNLESAAFGFALVVYSPVRIVGLEGDSFVLDVLERLVHETALASLVAVRSRAVDELLLGEGL